MTDQELYIRAHEFFTYKDGALYWKIDRKHTTCKVGMRAGGLSKSSIYRTVSINNKQRLEHRIIFLMCNGYLPEMIDHKNGDKTDNRIENLRASDKYTNQQNVGASKYGCGLKGAKRDRSRNKWVASIRVKKTRLFLGRFDTAEEAHEAYKAAAVKYHGEFARF
jgi:hypothetical protein